VAAGEKRENKKPDSGESGLAVVIALSFKRGAQELHRTIVAKPTRASGHA
jgi:hypothetical protein